MRPISTAHAGEVLNLRNSSPLGSGVTKPLCAMAVRVSTSNAGKASPTPFALKSSTLSIKCHGLVSPRIRLCVIYRLRACRWCVVPRVGFAMILPPYHRYQGKGLGLGAPDWFAPANPPPQMQGTAVPDHPWVEEIVCTVGSASGGGD